MPWRMKDGAYMVKGCHLPQNIGHKSGGGAACALAHEGWRLYGAHAVTAVGSPHPSLFGGSTPAKGRSPVGMGHPPGGPGAGAFLHCVSRPVTLRGNSRLHLSSQLGRLGSCHARWLVRVEATRSHVFSRWLGPQPPCSLCRVRSAPSTCWCAHPSPAASRHSSTAC